MPPLKLRYSLNYFGKRSNKPPGNRVGNPAVSAVIAIAGCIVTLHSLEHSLYMPHLPPYIKPLAWIIFLLAGAVLLYLYFQPVLKPAPPEAGHKKHTESYTKQGKVVGYGSNKMGDIDKFLLQSEQEKIWLHFPPHTAKQVMEIAKKGAVINVSIRAKNKKKPGGIALYNLVAVQNSNASIHIDAIPPPPPASGKQVQVSGKIRQYKLDKRGLVTGLIMDKYIVDIPPHIARSIAPLLKQAREITIKGYERSTENGFVNIFGLVLVKPYAITIDKTDYLL